MDKTKDFTAWHVVNQYSQTELEKSYGIMERKDGQNVFQNLL